MKDYNTYYWCPSCNHGFVESEVETRVVQEGYNHGHGNAERADFEAVCPGCQAVLSEGFQCDTCQEIVETTHKYHDSHYCIECLPLAILEKEYAAAIGNAASMLSFKTKIGIEKATELITEAENDLINNLYKGDTDV